MKHKGRDMANSRKTYSREMLFMIVGQDGVGKSAIVVRYLTHRFIGDYDPQLESVYSHMTKIDDQSILLKLWDTAGENQTEDNDRHEQIRKCDGFIFVFSLTDRDSFNCMKELRDRIIRIRQPNDKIVHSIVIGNKSDLSHFRSVDSSEGALFAKELGGQYYEMSASDGYLDIVDAFQDLYREIFRSEKRAKVKKITARLQLRQTIRNFTDRHIRARTYTL
ncbi:ras-related and estrogen-regulated growth inhibitor-like [Antedon mediterranea]|uniref:ras-related and estrogen-regulated growth inhibitor-like n=1 Tax=Antedon mediterranea TaxID=105859 RepID=UPI003AF95C21